MRTPDSERIRALASGLAGYPTLPALHASSFFSGCRDEIEALLSTPEMARCDGARPRLSGFLRIAQWNLEKGKRWERALRVLHDDPVLRWADIVLMNEADCGMSRSGNCHVALRLADALGMHAAFGAAHIELTKGTGDEADTPGENGSGLQGNAVLSRYPILNSVIVPLPVCFEPFEFHEKRYGRRICLWAKIKIGARLIWFGSVHLEVRNTPACRAAQMRHILQHMPCGSEPCLLGGDLNTNGFSRGTTWRTLGSVWRLVAYSPARVRDRLAHPERGPEPLFHAAHHAGFSWSGFNSSRPTASTPLSELEESTMLPQVLTRVIRRRLKPYRGHLEFKLDWLLARGVRPLVEGEAHDSAAMVTSLNPGAIEIPSTGPDRISDHVPIFADVALEGFNARA